MLIFRSVVAGKGILTSAFATGVLGFATAILFLFCTPDLDTLFALEAPQPFVQIYALALGKGGSIFMTIIAVIGLMLVRLPFPPLLPSKAYPQNTSIAIVAASRLVFAVARDGVLPLSGWISTVTADGQPRNAVTVIFVFAAALLCTILPSQVAFTSLVSAGGVPTIAAYGLIALLRLTLTPNDFQSSHFRLGAFAKPFYASAAFFNAIVFAVRTLPSSAVLAGAYPYAGYDLAFLFPCHRTDLQFREWAALRCLVALAERPQACVIFGSVTIFGIASWYFTPADKWLRRELVLQALQTADEAKGGE